jgi:hypothetical protein
VCGVIAVMACIFPASTRWIDGFFRLIFLTCPARGGVAVSGHQVTRGNNFA